MSRSCACRGDKRALGERGAQAHAPAASLVVRAEQGLLRAGRAARASRPAQASHDRRCRRRRARIRRTPGSGRDGADAISQDATGKFSSRWPLPERSSRGCRVMQTRAQLPPGRALPHAAAAARMLIGGIERERAYRQRDSRQRQAPQRRQPVEPQDRLERERHQQPRRRARGFAPSRRAKSASTDRQR